jgi:hypothetical protein
MNTDRTIEKAVGALFIIATVTSSLGFILLDPILGDANLLASVTDNENQLVLGAFLLLIDAIAVVVIPVLLFPIFRRHDEHLARLYPVSRVIESVVLTAGVIGLLALLTLSRDYAKTPSDASAFAIPGAALLAIYDWGVLLGVMLFFALAALILNYLLYRAALVPRWLSIWGLAGAMLLLIEGSLESFDVGGLAIMSAPIAVQEMVFAAWLITKGFDSPTVSPEVDSAIRTPAISV